MITIVLRSVLIVVPDFSRADTLAVTRLCRSSAPRTAAAADRDSRALTRFVWPALRLTRTVLSRIARRRPLIFTRAVTWPLHACEQVSRSTNALPDRRCRRMAAILILTMGRGRGAATV